MDNMFCIEVSDHIQILKNTYKNLTVNDVEIILLGNLYNKNYKEYDLQEVYMLYKKIGEKIYKVIDGTYSLIIIDNKIKKILIFQDYFGSNQNIYFTSYERSIYVSNKLREIVMQNSQKKDFNYEAVTEFLEKGFVTGKCTLVKNVYKIPPNKYLSINLSDKKVKLKSKMRENYNYDAMVSEKVYNETFKDICLSELSDKINVSISSGYDTNYLLYNFRNISKSKIETFCIGGKIGRNEIPDAEKICKYHKNVNFHSDVVSDVSLDNYPEIVFALEGAVYESGIFLQYELAKLLERCKKKEVIVGECADQVLNYEMYDKRNGFCNRIKYDFKNMLNMVQRISYKPYKDPYKLATYVILKKNGILMDYMKINVKYPYLRYEFIKIAKKVVKKNDMKKTYHKKVIEKTLPNYITEKLKKIGGATDLKALFGGNIKLEDVKEHCKTSRFYSHKRFNDKYYEIDYYMKIIYLELFEKIFLSDDHKYLKKESFKNYKLSDFFTW